MSRPLNATALCRAVDQVCDGMLASLGCSDESETILITHWQGGDRPGFRIQMTSRTTGRELTRFVGADGEVSA